MVWSQRCEDTSARRRTTATRANWGKLFAMRLNPPTIAIFLISLTLAILALITKLGFVGVPRYLPHQEFWLAITAYVTLMVGNLVRGV
jgi:hypothetical protein